MIPARGGVVAGLLILASSALAGAPVESLRPQMRAVAAAEVPHAADAEVVGLPFGPAPGPDGGSAVSQITSVATRQAALPQSGPVTSLRPRSRPAGSAGKAVLREVERQRGAICGDPDIQGEQVGRVPGKIKGCGIDEAVRVRSVAGVKLSQPALITCDAARALKTWVVNGAKPAFRQRGPLVELKVAADYVCRPRNNQRGAKISEHGRGRAIDISGFTMQDGEVVTVLQGWGRGSTLRPLGLALKAACGPFGTVLGPKSDGYHEDHFHMDVARYRNGPYCR
jgi:hypothetical protein